MESGKVLMESGKHSLHSTFVIFSVFLSLQVAISLCCSCSQSMYRRENVKSYETKEITCAWNGLVCLEWPRVPGMASCAWNGLVCLEWPRVPGMASCAWNGLVCLEWPRMPGMASCAWNGLVCLEWPRVPGMASCATNRSIYP